MKQPKWCRHIVWLDFKDWKGYVINPCGIVGRSWTLCPICKAKRPKRKENK